MTGKCTFPENMQFDEVTFFTYPENTVTIDWVVRTVFTGIVREEPEAVQLDVVVLTFGNC